MSLSAGKAPHPIEPETGVYDVYVGTVIVAQAVSVFVTTDQKAGEIRGQAVSPGSYTVRNADGGEFSVFVRSSTFDSRGGAVAWFVRIDKAD
jgi:hypothetical protein